MIGIIAHSEKSDALGATAALLAGLESRGVPYALEKHTAALTGRKSTLSERALAEQSALLVVLGGDGTMLRVVHRLEGILRPLFGINIGSLGFLTCLGPQEIDQAVECIARRDYILSQRMLIRATLISLSGKQHVYHALNDVVISRGQRSQLVKIHVTVDDEPLTDYNADGLVIATPTGSTAYSLSAGGPVLLPESGAMVITPICPHVLSNRSTVVSDASCIEAGLLAEGQKVFVTVDGQASHEMQIGDRLLIDKSDRVLPLAMLPGRSFSEVLRQKLKWSGSNV